MHDVTSNGTVWFPRMTCCFPPCRLLTVSSLIPYSRAWNSDRRELCCDGLCTASLILMKTGFLSTSLTTVMAETISRLRLKAWSFSKPTMLAFLCASRLSMYHPFPTTLVSAPLSQIHTCFDTRSIRISLHLAYCSPDTWHCLASLDSSPPVISIFTMLRLTFASSSCSRNWLISCKVSSSSPELGTTESSSVSVLFALAI